MDVRLLRDERPMGIERSKGTECSPVASTSDDGHEKVRLRTHYERNTKWSGKHRQLSACAFHFSHPFSCIRPPPARWSHCNWTSKFRRSCWFDTLSYSRSIKFRRGWSSGKRGNWWLLPLTWEKCEEIPETRFAKMRMPRRGVYTRNFDSSIHEV